MKTQRKLDKVLGEVKKRVQEEVGALMGVKFKLSELTNRIISKNDFFEELSGKKIAATMAITGEIEGTGGIVIGIKDAIRLGGTLIMLPRAELDDVAKSEKYTEEIEDSYGEIANIIAGSYTKGFEDSYPQDCRFVRKNQETISPVKVDIQSKEPFPEQYYYWVSASMTLDDMAMGDLEVLLPAESFGLEVPAEEASVENTSLDQPDTSSSADDKKNQPANDRQQDSIVPDSSAKDLTKEQKLKKQRKLDKVLGEVKGRVQEEVGALMGVKLKLSELTNRIISKNDFFEELSGKKIAATMAITGEIEGTGGIVIGIKDAIRLGGTLIMLPRAELDDVAKSENYTEEIEDSYGEIANIIAGSYTKGFEESYPQDCRFVRKKQETISPVKVDIQSKEPFPEQYYYWVSASMTLDDITMGNLEVLLPAEPFGLEVPDEEASVENASLDQPDTSSSDDDKSNQPVDDRQQDSTVSESDAQTAVEGQKPSGDKYTSEQLQQNSGTPELSAKDLAKHQKLLNKIITVCNDTIGQEVGALLGTDISLGKADNKIVTKEQVFEEELDGKQVLANMEISGGAEGEAFFSVRRKDAIRIGSTLIMLPPTELETAVNEEEFTADTEDAYGEIANIIAGVYTSVFQEQYTESLRFIKKTIAPISPLKVDSDSDDVIPLQQYYLSKSAIEIAGTKYGDVTLLLPAELFGLSQLGKSDTGDLVKTQKQQDIAAQAEGTEKQRNRAGNDVSTSSGQGSADVLLIENNSEEADKIEVELQDIGITTQRISFKDSVNNYLSERLRLVIIVMREVDEQAYGIAIKVSSKGGAPIVAAGSQWTRSKVIKAVKYGVTDILLVPAENEEIREKVNANIIKLAA